jgi:heme iron utilization protein
MRYPMKENSKNNHSTKKKSTGSAEKLKQQLGRLFTTQKLAVLSTSDDGQPYNNLVAFLASDDLSCIIFATTRATRKYANLIGDPRVSLLMDNRTNRQADFHRAIAVTVLGTAAELAAAERPEQEERFLARFPHLVDFVKSPSCALMKVSVSKYYIVSRFQNVIVMDVA